MTVITLFLFFFTVQIKDFVNLIEMHQSHDNKLNNWKYYTQDIKYLFINCIFEASGIAKIVMLLFVYPLKSTIFFHESTQ